MAKNSLNLFYTLKLDVSKIVSEDNYLGIGFANAKDSGMIVSLGDNQIFEFIRKIQNVDYYKLLDDIKKLTIKKNNIKKLENDTVTNDWQNKVNSSKW
mgnify:CR=1 FL=1